MNRERVGAAWAGVSLIGVGIVVFVTQFVGWDRVWPIFPLMGGLAFLVGYAVSGFRDNGLRFVGTAATFVGVFFFGFTLGVRE
jgi:hypothetical protein